MNGVATQPAVAAGTGAVAFGRAVHYADGPYDRVEVCVTVDYEAPDPTPSLERCDDLPYPGVVWDTLDEIGPLWLWPDPLLCVTFTALTGDYPGAVVLNSQGDVFVDGEPYYDCPPYDIEEDYSSYPEAHAAVVVVW